MNTSDVLFLTRLLEKRRTGKSFAMFNGLKNVENKCVVVMPTFHQAKLLQAKLDSNIRVISLSDITSLVGYDGLIVLDHEVQLEIINYLFKEINEKDEILSNIAKALNE